MNNDIKINEDYRSVLATARKLETLQTNLESITDFFLTPLVKLYSKLCDDCLKLFFSSEFKLDQYRKAEELVWRRIYHDIYRFQRTKKETIKRHDECLIESHFISGIGFYSSLVVKLRSYYKIRHVTGVVAPLNLSLGPIDNFVENQRLNEDSVTNGGEGTCKKSSRMAKEWARQAIYRSLVYMGDLARYLLETSQHNYRKLAFEFYCSASQNQPDHGLPFNQLATLATSFNYNLGAVCNYMRCCLRPKPFEGAEGNMRKIFELNNKFYEEISIMDPVKVSEVLSSEDPNATAESMMRALIVTFIKLTSDIWVNVSDNIEVRIFFETLREALELEPIVRALGLVSLDKSFAPISGESSPSELPKYVSPTIMYEFCSVSMMLIAKNQLRPMNDPVISLVNTLTLNLLYYSTSKCQKTIMSKLQELRLGHEVESPMAFIYNHTYLTTIKIYCDWLLSNGNVVSSNLQSFRTFSGDLDELSSLLSNLIKMAGMKDITNGPVSVHSYDGPSWVQRYPLSCDFPLLNLPPLKNVHETNIDFSHQRELEDTEAGFMTAQCVIAFSHALTAFLNKKEFQ